MKKFIFMMFVLFVSRESSASLMQLTYDNFYAPVSPSNFPVDRSGVVSFSYDDAAIDSDLNDNSGLFVNPLQNGFMFLGGIQYEINVAASSEMSTFYSLGFSYLQTTGTIVNQELGRVRSFMLYFGGSLSATAGQTLKNIFEDCFALHLIVFDPNAVVNSPEYNAAYASYENGKVGVGPYLASVPESSALMLFLLGIFAVGAARVRKQK